MSHIRIEDPDDRRLDVFRSLRDAVLRSYPGTSDGLFMGESRKVIERALSAGYKPYAVLVEDAWIERSYDLLDRIGSMYPDAPVFTCDHAVFEAVTGFRIVRCSLAAFHRKPLPSLADLLDGARRVAVLENITNYANIGAIFRAAAGLGVDAVLVTPSCHDPLYHRAARVSMGTVFQVPWTRVDATGAWAQEGAGQLRSFGFKLAALALEEDSVPLDAPELKCEEKLALVLGTEGEGLCKDTIAACDYTVRIPMYNRVDSLNVAAASAVAFWELRARP